MLRRLIELGAEIHLKNSEGKTALHAAAEGARLSNARQLVCYGASVREMDIEGRTPLTLALSSLKRDNEKIVEYLIEEDPDQLLWRDKEGRTLAHRAASHICCPALSVVLQLHPRGTGVMEGDRKGQTPLHHAALSGRTANVELLVEHRAVIDAVDGQGMTALLYAVQDGHAKMASTLIAKGVNVNMKDIKGRSALHFAVNPEELSSSGSVLARRALLRRLKCAGNLIMHGAELEAKDLRGYTPLMAAVEKGRGRTVAGLLGSGADARVRDHEDRALLELARKRGKADIVWILQRHDTRMFERT